MKKKFSMPLSGILVSFVLASLLFSSVKADGPILSLDGMLPSKSDDPATYPVLQEPDWYFGISWSEHLNESGFLDGRAVEYYQRFRAHSDMSVEFYVYLFSNVSNAQAYCNNTINQTKSNGGYTEVPIPDVFAVVYNYVTQEIGISYGVVSNVVFEVAVYTANIVEDPTDRLVTFTSLERTRILEKSNLNTIPEFPSIIILPLFVLATLIIVKNWGKLPHKNELTSSTND